MPQPSSRTVSEPAGTNGHAPSVFAQPPADLLQQLGADVAQAGGELPADPERQGAVGATMFDLPGSEDNSVTVLLPQDHAQRAPAQTLVRIRSQDGRRYLGVVTAGPFAEPDTLRADSHLLVTVTARGGVYLPPYHGRLQIAILGEELPDGTLVPPRLRPLPNSPVFALTAEESAAVLRTDGDLRLGLAVGHANVAINVPSSRKDVLPRHLAVLGTTGGGKSTTVARLVHQAQAAGMAVILLDVEGQYTHLHEPADHAQIVAALAARDLRPEGIPAARSFLIHLVGRDTTNPRHPQRSAFSLQFARLSPYAVAEMLGMNDAQESRFHYAYGLTKTLMRDLGIFPQKDKPREELERQESLALRTDEFERGWPRMTLSLQLDVVSACLATVTKTTYQPWNPELRNDAGRAALARHLKPKEMEGSAASWGKVKSLLWRLHRLGVFDRHRVKRGAPPLRYAELLQPGRVTVVDLSDAGMTELANLAIADLLRGVQEAQDTAYRAYEQGKAAGEVLSVPPRVLVVIEEAHEFLSAERIDKTPQLFQQISRIAKRGRKRWLSLAFVTQLPGHLPRQLFGLVNNYCLHKITDPQVVHLLRYTVSGIDESLWSRLPGLAPGQAVVSFGHMTRPLLASIDPAPCKLRMED
jgi:DNA helicase HerA-like ATPase